MPNTQLDAHQFLDAIQRNHLARAEKWWFYSKGLSFLVFIIGVAITFNIGNPQHLAALTVMFTLFYVVAEWWAIYLWDVAQAILRKFEFNSGLGWGIKRVELANLQVRTPKSLLKQLEEAPPKLNEYFASTSNPSPRKLVENLEESSWYTMHMADRSYFYFSLFTIAVFLLALGVSVAALTTSVNQQPSDEVVSKAVVAVIVFMFTAGYVRQSSDYNRYFREAQLIEEKALNLMDKPDIQLDEAVKLLSDYQFLRYASPPLLSPIWKLLSSDLNKSRDQHVRRVLQHGQSREDK